MALVAAIGSLAWWALSHRSAPQAAPIEEAVSIVSRFSGASEDRTFLTEFESEVATKRGLLPAGTLSVIDTGGTMDFGEWHWDDEGVPDGPLGIRVDLERQLISIFRGRHEIGTAVIVYGVDGKDTPRGDLPILGKTEDYHSITYDAPMPYSLWLRDDGVAIHGSNVSANHATNGCIGVPVEFAAHLFEVAKKGDVVHVLEKGETA